jgi:N-acetylmuramoyl-L-alanine amidase
MRNAGDAQILSTATGRMRLADALAAGVERFLADQAAQRPAPTV